MANVTDSAQSTGAVSVLAQDDSFFLAIAGAVAYGKTVGLGAAVSVKP